MHRSLSYLVFFCEIGLSGFLMYVTIYTLSPRSLTTRSRYKAFILGNRLERYKLVFIGEFAEKWLEEENATN